jgi:hypothetical protein
MPNGNNGTIEIAVEPDTDQLERLAKIVYSAPSQKILHHFLN